MINVSAGLVPTVLESRKGLKYIYWLNDTTIEGQVRDNVNAVVKDTFTAIPGVDADSGIAVEECWKTGGIWQIGIIYKQAGVLTFAKSNNGFDFT